MGRKYVHQKKAKKIYVTTKFQTKQLHVIMPKNTLYVTGFTRESKAVDLAPEFEKYVS